MHDTKAIRVDLYTKAVLTAIALLLAVLAFRPIFSPSAVQAQADSPSLYIEPGVTTIQSPDGSYEGAGKMVIDLRTGDAWGFPTIQAAAVHRMGASKTPVIKPSYLGRFDFSAMKRVP